MRLGGIILIYITGDTHADLKRFEKVKLKDKDTLIICGDFGFIWDGGEKEEKILKKIGNQKYTTLFLDGTHENFDLLKKYEITSLNGANVRKIHGNLYHLMRGQIITLEGKNIFVFGGGESTDKEMRISCNKWWGEELPTINEMKDAVCELNKIDRNVDYIITHEPPAFIKNIVNSSLRLNALNKFLDDVAKEVKFKHWYFGSVHLNKEFTQKYSAIFNNIIKLL